MLASRWGVGEEFRPVLHGAQHCSGGGLSQAAQGAIGHRPADISQAIEITGETLPLCQANQNLVLPLGAQLAGVALSAGFMGEEPG
jgi:hypothetical protein